MRHEKLTILIQTMIVRGGYTISYLRAVGRTSLNAIRHNSTKPFYVTSPIFYVNASPHLGHAYSMLLCDTRSRWEKLDPSKKSYFLTGTDEHGLKIQAAAENRGMEPKQLVDEVSENFKVLATKLNFDYDRFMRTTDKDHVETVNYFWKAIESKGLIYQGSHSGWYSVSDETFYPENQIEEATNKEGKTIMRCKESRSEVVFQEETNYFFKLSEFQDQLIEYIESHPKFIIPHQKYQEVLRDLKQNKLTDLSISRPSSRLKWSIEVPNDPSQKIYVWFDALINYITAAGFPAKFEKHGEKYVSGNDNIWPATHVVGKDIIKFHCVYWPIMLMAIGAELPRQVVVHAHWLSEGFKMSKSLGNVVDPVATYEHYGEDALRFFLSEYSNIESDCNFSEESFSDTRDTLISKYANLVTRVSGAKFNIEESVKFNQESRFEGIDEVITNSALVQAPEIIRLKNELISTMNQLYQVMDDRFVNFEHMKAIQEWWKAIDCANLFFQRAEPWAYNKLIKDTTLSEEDTNNYKLLQNYFVYLAAESSRICSIVISPVIPSLSDKILTRLAVKKDHRSKHYTKVGTDHDYGVNANSKHENPIQRVPIRTSV
jgi:methionyl-tRNA synthetase